MTARVDILDSHAASYIHSGWGNLNKYPVRPRACLARLEGRGTGFGAPRLTYGSAAVNDKDRSSIVGHGCK